MCLLDGGHMLWHCFFGVHVWGYTWPCCLHLALCVHAQQAEDDSSSLLRPNKRQCLSLDDTGTQELACRQPQQSPLSVMATSVSTAVPANAAVKCTDSEASDSAASDGGHMHSSSCQEAWAGEAMQAGPHAATLLPSIPCLWHGIGLCRVHDLKQPCTLHRVPIMLHQCLLYMSDPMLRSAHVCRHVHCRVGGLPCKEVM